MIPVTWNMINPMTGQPLRWGDRNLRWGNPSYLLEPGDPGFVPYDTPPPPEKKHKPFHRLPHSQTNNTQTNHTTPPMSTYKYHVAPKSGGGFTTRAVLGDQIAEDQLTAQLAAAAGVTADQAANVIRGLFTRLLEAAAGGAWSSGLYDSISMRPTSGGNETAPDAFHNADDLAANVQITFRADKIRTWRAGLSLESMGEVGLVTPVIETILSEENGSVDHYVAGTLVRLRGNNLKFKKSDVTQGVFFKPGAGAEVRATVYGILDPSETTVLVPAALSGPLTVRVAASINGSLRSYTYTHPIS